MMGKSPGRVYLVGAGPGDPGLLTIKAAQLIASADVIVLDNLIGEQILAMIPESTRQIYVGKHEGSHTMDQHAINQLLVDLASDYRSVVRLKGGDPFIFGRGAEEAETLALHDLEFEIVPGVSSGMAVPAYAGIPLTHRDHASSFGFVTGHEAPDKYYDAVNWEKASTLDTIVVFMGIRRLAMISERLIHAGKSPDTPVAVIRRGTLPDQQTVLGTLADIVQKVDKAQLKAPAIIVIGQVATMHKRIDWTPKTVCQTGLVLLAHGSPADNASAPIKKIAKRIQSMYPSTVVTAAFLDHEVPDVFEAVENMAQLVSSIIVVPMFLAEGGHIQKDMPALAQNLAIRYPEIKFTFTPVIGQSTLLASVVAGLIQQYAE